MTYSLFEALWLYLTIQDRCNFHEVHILVLISPVETYKQTTCIVIKIEQMGGDPPSLTIVQTEQYI